MSPNANLLFDCKVEKKEEKHTDREGPDLGVLMVVLCNICVAARRKKIFSFSQLKLESMYSVGSACLRDYRELLSVCRWYHAQGTGSEGRCVCVLSHMCIQEGISI